MFEQAFKNIDDALRREAGCTTELDYTEQTSWLLFLKYLDGLEQDKADEAALDNKKYSFILDKPYRWESWAAPKGKDGQLDHNKALSGDDPTVRQTSAVLTTAWTVQPPATAEPSYLLCCFCSNLDPEPWPPSTLTPTPLSMVPSLLWKPRPTPLSQLGVI